MVETWTLQGFSDSQVRIQKQIQYHAMWTSESCWQFTQNYTNTMLKVKRSTCPAIICDLELCNGFVCMHITTSVTAPIIINKYHKPKVNIFSYVMMVINKMPPGKWWQKKSLRKKFNWGKKKWSSGLRNVFLIPMTRSWIGVMNISWKGRQKLLHGTDSRTLIRIMKKEVAREKLSHKPWQWWCQMQFQIHSSSKWWLVSFVLFTKL